MTRDDAIRRLENNIRYADKRATAARWDHKRQQAKGAARAYRKALALLAQVRP